MKRKKLRRKKKTKAEKPSRESRALFLTARQKLHTKPADFFPFFLSKRITHLFTYERIINLQISRFNHGTAMGWQVILANKSDKLRGNCFSCRDRISLIFFGDFFSAWLGESSNCSDILFLSFLL